MLKAGDLVTQHTIEDAYYGFSASNLRIGLIVDTVPIKHSSRDFKWYVILLNGDIKTMREDEIYKLEENKIV